MPIDSDPRPGGPPTEQAGLRLQLADQLLRRSHQAALRTTTGAAQTRERVQLTYQRAHRTADTAQELFHAAAAVADRFVEIKQREVAAHLAAVQLHEQAAALQDRLGWPDRAAAARAHAAHAREFYELATQELAQYVARVRAARDRIERPT